MMGAYLVVFLIRGAVGRENLEGRGYPKNPKVANSHKIHGQQVHFLYKIT